MHHFALGWVVVSCSIHDSKCHPFSLQLGRFACQGRMNSAVGSLTYAAPEVRRDEHTAKANPIVGVYRVAG